MGSLRYFSVAVLLSLAWWPVLQISPDMHELLWHGALHTTMIEGLILFAITGVVVAALFRNVIVRAGTARSYFLGAVLPFIAAEVFALLLWGYQRNEELLIELFWAPLFTLGSVYVVIPFGIVVQFLMRWAGGGGRASPTPP